MKWVFMYLCGTSDYGLCYKEDQDWTEFWISMALLTILAHTKTSLTCIPVLSYPSPQSLQDAYVHVPKEK